MLSLSCRTALFTPADRPDRYEKAGSNKYADAVVLDLEDAVPLDRKDKARSELVSYLAANKKIPADHPMLTGVRINGLSTLAGLADITALASCDLSPDFLFLPKVESADEIRLYSALLDTPALAEAPFVVAVETAYGLQGAHKIAACPRVAVLVFGGADLTDDLGAVLTLDATLPWRARIVQAAKSAGKQAWDVPFLDIHDDAGLKEEALRVKAIGYDGKVAIHPGQLQTLAEAFMPGVTEYQDARGLLDAYRAARGQACQYKGKMVDKPVVEKARKIVAAYEKYAAGDL